MKYKAAGGVLFGALLSITTFGGIAVATDGDDPPPCPPGTTFDYKIDNLSGPTFTVPTPPAGWTITGVILKAGTEHLLITPVTPGQVLDVKTLMGHDVSHVHVCKKPETTTTTSSTTSTTSTTTTIPATTTTICVDCTPGTQVVIPTTTTTQPPGDDTGGTTTTQPAVVVTTTTIANPVNPVTTTTQPAVVVDTTTTVAPNLPPTGFAGRIAALMAVVCFALGGGALFATRRK